ncbi:hypothetical protein FRC08_018463 [Ceratobasidium sp. 394]|nr:hypothetical protein FRC08_018463 [Ceratobasidium sp. 394]KAG9098401.1 hypothetical protein FS749_003894 [Ceratobasidium sp. UAMH 11750]
MAESGAGANRDHRGADANTAPGKAETRTVHTTERLVALRALMKENQVDTYVVVSEDQHSSEYLANCDTRRAFICGFDGSAGCAVITHNRAHLFTDGRYFLQAEQQLDSNWTLMKQGLPGVPTWQEFLAKKLPKGTKIGIDPTLISVSDATSLKTSLTPRSSSLVPISRNLIDTIWTSRPPRPANPIHPLPIEYSGAPAAEKLAVIRAKIGRAGAAGVVVSLLDEVAWLVGMRGGDIEFNPVFFAYALVLPTEATLFVNDSQLTSEAKENLKDAGWDVAPYDSIIARLEQVGSTIKDVIQDQKQQNKEEQEGEEVEAKGEGHGKILIDPKTSLAVAHALGEGHYHVIRSGVADAKSVKNAVELEGFRKSHIRDGVALARYFAHLEEHLTSSVTPKWTEYQAALVLEGYRRELDLFKGLSFSTISSTGPNGAIIHYSPPEKGSAEIKLDQMYLCDSGAQFLDGTTDVTRTWHFGTPAKEEKRAFTRVVQGHIAIDTAVFPSGTTGYVLDAFARRALWADGLDYRQAPGAIRPQGIGTRIAYNDTKLKEGMVLSNEPGYYADGKFGIRIESIVLVRKVTTPNDFGARGYLGFENVTMCPIQTKLVDIQLLTGAERDWLNAYHAEVLAKVGPELEKIGDKRAQAWLERECAEV